MVSLPILVRTSARRWDNRAACAPRWASATTVQDGSWERPADDPPADHRHDDVRFPNGYGRHRKNVLRQNRKIGEFSNLEAADLAVCERGVRRSARIGVDGLPHGHVLFRSVEFAGGAR